VNITVQIHRYFPINSASFCHLLSISVNVRVKWLHTVITELNPNKQSLTNMLIDYNKQTLNFQIWVVRRRSSRLRRVSGTSLFGCSAMSLMSRTYVTEELDFTAAAADDADLWGSRGADEPSCCSMPVLDIRHSCDLFPGSYSHHYKPSDSHTMPHKFKYHCGPSSVSTLAAWNRLPETIRQAQIQARFKKPLKIFLFTEFLWLLSNCVTSAALDTKPAWW